MKKRRRYLTVIIAPHHRGRQRSYHISYSSLRWMALAGAALAALVLLLLVSYGKIYWRAGQYELMRKRQAEMEAEFGKLRQIKAELARLRSEEARVRQMLGVPKQPDTLTTAEVARLAPAAGQETAGAPETVPNSDRLLPTLLPTRGWISSGLSPQHTGVDIAARLGQPILASADGLVEFAGWDNYFGNKLVIRHGKKITTMYGHCDKLLVDRHQPVRRGQVIALVGSSGKSTGPHLHFEMTIDGKTIDPVGFWLNR